MPIYAYECRECGVRFERRQSFSEAPVAVCPECEGSVQRLIQPAGIIFKGSGFYVTDNKSSRNSAAPSSSKSKPDAKPEAKPETGGDSSTASTASDSSD